MTQLVFFCRALIKHSQEYDKRQHFFYSLALMLVAALVLQIWGAALVVVLIGLAKECWDHYWGSGFCWLDMLANTMGIAAGSVIVWLFEYVFAGVIHILL
ncbi:hypothetical protein [Marinobacter sp.]|jgi:hypothetical protein|uniref:hypothetical protein n=1 Tax=Marinobacter sp. TaxID=50741 RepID=UPI003A94CB7D